MTSNEQEIIEHLKTQHNKYFVPLVWTTSLLTRARREGLVKDDFALKTLIDVRISISFEKRVNIIVSNFFNKKEVNDFRGRLGTLLNYDWVSVPLVYTQVRRKLYFILFQ